MKVHKYTRTMDLSEIKPYQENAKIHTQDQIEKLAKSIKRFGFNVPIVLDKNKEIIAGHGRLEAAKLLGFTEARETGRAKVGEMFVPFVFADDLTPQEVKAYRLADNKLNESPWEMGLVVEELHQLHAEGFDISLTGFMKEDIELFNKDFTKEKAINEEEDLIECPKCGYEF